jgi:predicted esterase
MMKCSTITGFVILSLCTLGEAISQGIDYEGFPEWSWHEQDSTEYYLYVPTGLKPGERYPVALFLHGCCGTSYKATLRNTVDPPVRMWHNFGINTQEIPTYIIAPSTKRGWKQHIPNLKKIIDDLIATGKVDPQRIYITGFSMGAQGTWQFLQQYPDFFAAAIPMGMDFSGDPEKIRHIPIWTNRGATDWWARNLDKQVSLIRKLNGNEADSSNNWITGVNPRFTSFKNIDHGVQWVATSKQDLTGWAYSKVNDGNKYPTVFFKSPVYGQMFRKGHEVSFEVNASDSDGKIVRVELKIQGKRAMTLTEQPYRNSFLVSEGDNFIEAVAFDDKGKFSIAELIVSTDINSSVETKKLPLANAGAWYNTTLIAKGNRTKIFSLSKGKLPPGISITSEGVIKGIPTKNGKYSFTAAVADYDGDKGERDLVIEVLHKRPGDIVVTDARNYAGKIFPTSKLLKGEAVHNDRADDEVTVSDPGNYEGLTILQTDVYDTINAKPFYLEFTVDENASVYIAYERTGGEKGSDIPQWLKLWTKEPGRKIVTQYFYYDVYRKDFPKGKVQIEDAEEKTNRVNTNYFVMIKRRTGAE